MHLYGNSSRFDNSSKAQNIFFVYIFLYIFTLKIPNQDRKIILGNDFPKTLLFSLVEYDSVLGPWNQTGLCSEMTMDSKYKSHLCIQSSHVHD